MKNKNEFLVLDFHLECRPVHIVIKNGKCFPFFYNGISAQNRAKQSDEKTAPAHTHTQKDDDELYIPDHRHFSIARANNVHVIYRVVHFVFNPSKTLKITLNERSGFKTTV